MDYSGVGVGLPEFTNYQIQIKCIIKYHVQSSSLTFAEYKKDKINLKPFYGLQGHKS